MTAKKLPVDAKSSRGFEESPYWTAHFRKKSCIIKVMRGRFVTGSLALLIPLVLFLTFAGGAITEPPSPNLDAHACAAQAAGLLDARLDFWRQRLNLADWKISVVLSHASDLKPKTLGNIHWDANTKTAVIRVLDASDYRVSCRQALSDMELTLVHELVHLELSSLPRSPASRREEEFAVNRIADALVRLDRQKASLPAGAEGGGRTAALGSEPDTPRSRRDAPALAQ